MSPSLLRLGQTLRGRLGNYIITKQIQETVWLAKDQTEQSVVIKGVHGHPRVENEQDILKRFQDRTPFLRRLTDEIEDPSDPTIIVLKHLDDHLLNASIEKTLNRKELKYISKRILEALKVLHEDGYVHTDVKLDNVFVNYNRHDTNGLRFSDVQLGDLGGTYPADSNWARKGTPVGAPMWSSPEVIMETPWNTATDIWSFGAVLISLIYGGNFNLFRPKTVPYGHEEYGLEVLKQQFRYFGPFPGKYEEIAGPMTVKAILYLMQEIPQSKTTPFYRTTEKEVCKKDKEFIGKIMMMDWRDRPTAGKLLEDEWFKEED
ncbi:serine/threonine protein kinase [Histoplasma capsulatum var. duboisii H88]|uniref:Serine/threonine protein kinase n=1 Tax=Ajellomyces capsulatus (strain H88) TaxID=544711 RepID=F0UDZ6_AJEC8|nr:serine/threonine protein kinase [Histoplasma capsulatum var. duboisii H88]QSS48829.1 serine/threonine protein kinase [Histoplasma capsulatum var. duboisii H88]